MLNMANYLVNAPLVAVGLVSCVRARQFELNQCLIMLDHVKSC